MEIGYEYCPGGGCRYIGVGVFYDCANEFSSFVILLEAQVLQLLHGMAILRVCTDTT